MRCHAEYYAMLVGTEAHKKAGKLNVICLIWSKAYFRTIEHWKSHT